MLLHRFGDLLGGVVPLPDDPSWRSSWVIRPLSYWPWISATCALVAPEDLALVGGMITSFLEIVMPACVAYLNPRSLNASRTRAIAAAP